ncbi:papain family cysteine protease domain-containing protein [Phthorimaea operculella]|nr:papain family cysteine protease domain-containing protein [Phthorimaea operculella]
MQKFQKKYKNQEELHRRLKIFKDSLSRTKALRESESGTASYGITKFSDMTPDEFRRTMLTDPISFQDVFKDGDYDCTCDKNGRGKECKLEPDIEVEHGELPQQFDWRTKGVVGPVLNQRRCLSCYGHSVVGVMESMVKISRLATNLPRLSIQELIDCSNYTNKCHGGNPALAMGFLCDYGLPVVGEEMYPLVNKNQNCKLKTWPKKGVVLTRIMKKQLVSPIGIARLISSHGPVVTTVNSNNWQYYINGVIEYHCEGSDLHHVVQIVGYNLEAAEPYFICRNSWGADWGEDGYVRIAIQGGNNRTCGVGTQITALDVDVL